MKIGVLLSGCGVYDGAEIQEAVLTLLAIEEIDAEAICISIDKDITKTICCISCEWIAIDFLLQISSNPTIIFSQVISRVT